ncbi:hypothetical protein B0T18DRAFT_487439 [Schizothecium vesticola]|uniref:Uncharacterized protein n=1 Tax=Schizothecium vesticola TaxID=314040 RepID=A0AA40F1N4_9PEZI|nr:hypothetical protein B0T18DRAFT_487439 [Schizothecium vesticola]
MAMRPVHQLKERPRNNGALKAQTGPSLTSFNPNPRGTARISTGNIHTEKNFKAPWTGPLTRDAGEQSHRAIGYGVAVTSLALIEIFSETTQQPGAQLPVSEISELRLQQVHSSNNSFGGLSASFFFRLLCGYPITLSPPRKASCRGTRSIGPFVVIEDREHQTPSP